QSTSAPAPAARSAADATGNIPVNSAAPIPKSPRPATAHESHTRPAISQNARTSAPLHTANTQTPPPETFLRGPPPSPRPCDNPLATNPVAIAAAPPPRPDSGSLTSLRFAPAPRNDSDRCARFRAPVH